MLSCRACGRKNREDARFCDGCGGRLGAVCGRCGRTLPRGASTCSACGVYVADATPHYGRPQLPALPESFGGGRYRTLRLLGEGARKWVYLARDERITREVAIAVLKAGELDPEALLRVERESEVMARLGDHPRIVSGYDVGRQAGEIFVVYRYMAGGQLEARLGQGDRSRVPVRDALRIAEQLLQGLEHVHARGVIHRDLRPASVFFDGEGAATLGGLGLACLSDHAGDARAIVGTVAYMPPERVLGQPADTRNDLYSFGALLYELLCGRLPFVGDDAVAVIAQHLHASPTPPSALVPQIPPELSKTLERLLAKEPGDRPQRATEVREELAALLREINAPPVRRAAARSGRTRGPADSILVGRAREEERLRTALRRALDGEGRVLVVEGEPGIGKTSLAERMADVARALGASALWGPCQMAERAPAYWPWVQILRDYTEGLDAKSLRRDLGPAAVYVAQLLPELIHELPEITAFPESVSGEARYRLFDGITRTLCRASERQPLVLVFDDLHAADTASLLLLQYFVRELGAARLLVLVTYREETLSAEHPLAATLADLARHPTCEHLTLEGIAEGEVGRFIERVAGVAPSPNVTAAVYRHTEGNPFFMTEVVRVLVDRFGTGCLQEPRVPPIPLPQGVRDVLGQRFKQLSERCRNALATAAVVGRDFELDVLEPACELPRPELLKALDEAISARLVHPREEARGRYGFGHALIRETLYDEIGPAQRAHLHARIADVLEQQYPDRVDEHLAALAHHLVQGVPAGAPAEKALRYSLRAAERAARLLAHEEAVEHHQHALQALQWPGMGDPELCCELLLALGTALWKTGKMDRSKEVFQRAAALARELGRFEALGRAAIGYGGTGYTGVWETTGTVNRVHVELLEEALERLDPGDSPLRARLLGRLGIALYWDPGRERRDALTRQAVQMAERLDDPVVQWHALSARQLATWDPDDLDERLTRTQRMIRLALQAGSPELAAQSRIWRVAALLEAGDIDAADSELAAYTALAAELHEPQYLWRSAMLGGTRALMRGELARSEQLAFQGYAYSQLMTHANRLQAFAIQLACVRREQGRLGEIESAIERVMTEFPGLPSWTIASGILYWELHRVADARRVLESVTSNGFREVPFDYLWLCTLAGAAELCALLDDTERAPLLYELLQPYRERFIVVGDAAAPIGPAAWFLGLLARTMDRDDVAERHFEHTLEISRRMHLPLFEARARLGLAEIFLDRDGSAGSADAERQLDRGLDLASRFGSRLLLERAVDRKLRIQGIDPRKETSIGFIAARVQATRPGLASAVSQEGMVTLLFSDMEGFSTMTERLGDQEAHRVVGAHNAIVREHVRLQGGLEVEMQGDAVLLAFPSRRRALRCGVGIQRGLEAHNREHPEESIRVRMGLHTGEAIHDADRFFGKTVIVAARIAALARGGEILVSSLFREVVEESPDLRLSSPREVLLKGLADPYTVYAVNWAPET